jgi:hypothetical protein
MPKERGNRIIASRINRWHALFFLSPLQTFLEPWWPLYLALLNPLMTMPSRLLQLLFHLAVFYVKLKRSSALALAAGWPESESVTDESTFSPSNPSNAEGGSLRHEFGSKCQDMHGLLAVRRSRRHQAHRRSVQQVASPAATKRQDDVQVDSALFSAALDKIPGTVTIMVSQSSIATLTIKS